MAVNPTTKRRLKAGIITTLAMAVAIPLGIKAYNSYSAHQERQRLWKAYVADFEADVERDIENSIKTGTGNYPSWIYAREDIAKRRREYLEKRDQEQRDKIKERADRIRKHPSIEDITKMHN